MHDTKTADRPAQVVEQPAAGGFFLPRRLGHVNLYVSDYDASQKFFFKVAGFREAYRQPDDRNAFLSNGNSYHDITLMDIHGRVAKAKNIQRTGLNHLAFELETEVDLVDGYRRALQVGMNFDDVMDHDVAHSVYTADPDGNRVEMYADVIKEFRSARHGLITKAKPKYDPGVTSTANAERNYPQNPRIDFVEEAIFHPKKTSHACLITKDFDTMVSFYRDFAGLSVFAADKCGAFVILRGTHSQGDVTIVRQQSASDAGMHHFGCDVWDEDDLNRSLTAAAQAGITIERIIDHPARRAAYLKDPDGIRIQFYVNREWQPDVIEAITPEEAAWLL